MCQTHLRLFYFHRSLGLQLASFETKEKADSITTYLTNAGKIYVQIANTNLSTQEL